MSLDRTLKTHGGLARKRSVLTRAERIARLTDEGKFDPEKDSPMGLPKLKVRHSKVGTKTKKAEEKPEAEVGVTGEGAAEGAAAESESAEPKAKE